MADKKKPIDWPAIKADWLNSNMSIRRLAGWYQVSEAAIRKKASQEAWGERAQGKSAQQKPTAHSTPEPMIMAGIDATDPEQIVGRGQNLILRLMDELDASTSNAETIEELIDIHIEEPRAKAAMMKAVSLSGRAGVIKALATALKTLSEAKTAAPEGKKAQRQAAAEAVATSGNKFAPRSGPRLAVSNG